MKKFAATLRNYANKVSHFVLNLADWADSKGLLTVDLILLYAISLVVTSQLSPLVVPALALVPLLIWLVLRFYDPEE